MTRFFVFSLGILISVFASAQGNYQINTDSTAVPFLRISPDARAGGMGDGGVACANDVNAMHWNLSNLAFAKKKFSLGISYTPWLRALVPDINLAYVGFYLKPDSVSAIGASMRYFSMGPYTFMGTNGHPVGQFRPNEFALDVGYTRKVTQHFSVGITARFIRSNLAGMNAVGLDFINGMACAGDLSAAWKGDAVGSGSKRVIPQAGFCISNLGPKMWYRDRDSAEFLPMNARFGGGLLIAVTEHHEFALQAEANKLLVPTSSAVLSAKEKLAQIALSSGLEYVYERMFKFRGGYYHEFRPQGNNRYITTGVGIEYSVFQLDFSYLIPVRTLQSPLENTVRFTLLIDFNSLHKAG
jgi:hypothetical protein